MSLTIELHLKTFEVYRLFEFKIDEKRLFMDSVFKKINRIDLAAPETHLQVEQDLRSLISEFTQKTELFEKILESNTKMKTKTINVTPRFHISIHLTNKLGILLIEFVNCYDNLIALIKLLHLSACFDSDAAYYTNLKNVKKIGNRTLSKILLLNSKIKAGNNLH